jgi:rhamnosyltransferase
MLFDRAALSLEAMATVSGDRFGLVIPTLNAGADLDRLVPALRSQSLRPSKFLVIDSSSTDDTVARLEAIGAEVQVIDRRTFDHGGTRQRAVETLVETDIVVFLTQDAVPADPNTLQNLVGAFQNPSVGAAYGRQLPAPNATPIAAHARLFNYPRSSELRSMADANRLGIKTAFCSNSFAAYRRKALLEAGGFPAHAILSEDMLVVAAMLAKGWDIMYVASAQVYHSHNYTMDKEFRRYFDIGVLHGTHPEIIARFGTPAGEGWRFLHSELGYLSRAAPFLIPNALVRTVSKYLGYRLGRLASYLPTAFNRRISMNPGYWRQRTILPRWR